MQSQAKTGLATWLAAQASTVWETSLPNC